tara:strand:- start:233 stop:385 length:153 start_codon:yes stop_codon:yes gene_type:complete
MTNKEKAELRDLMGQLDYWQNLTMRMLIDNKQLSQKNALIKLRTQKEDAS